MAVLTLFQEMMLTSEKKGYKPNVMVIFKERSFVPIPKMGFVNPIYGNADRARMMDNELDERAYERTILRHSTFFERMRALRMNINASGPYILGETEVHDVPDYRTREKYCDGLLEYIEKDGKVHKRLLIPEEGIFELYPDGSVNWMYSSHLTPHLTFKDGESICNTISPLTDTLTSYGENGSRLCRFFSAENVKDEITPEGGKASFSFGSSAYGLNVEHVDVSLEIFPMQHEEEEIFPLDGMDKDGTGQVNFLDNIFESLKNLVETVQ